MSTDGETLLDYYKKIGLGPKRMKWLDVMVDRDVKKPWYQAIQSMDQQEEKELAPI